MRSLPSLQDALYDIVRSLAENRNDVIVSKIVAPTKAFEVRVSLEDHDLVLSSLHLIKELASGLAGMSDWEDLRIELLVNDTDQSEIETDLATRVSIKADHP